MDIKACIFDLDGVIVDTAKHHYKSWQKIAHDLGFEFTEQQNEGLKGISRYDSLTKLLDIGGLQKSEDEKQELCRIKNDYYLQIVQAMGRQEVLPGVLGFIKELKSEGIRIALGSASKNAKLILKLLGLTHEFDAIVDGNDVSKSKPDPEVFVKGAGLLGVDPNNTIVIEDSQKGLEAAVNGGFKTVGIGHPDILTIADIVFDSFEHFTLDTLKMSL